ncbi:universal stress protein [Pseudonocardia kujensis]|uniref:universal stress protein n=1 Tax=Pseudonocardia kujensis TaxID=1128675 RepID=UPI001E4E90DA|nr:universal stress protein [Pseudonocardia kujensis]MCE0764446.1 universal stress protein [Pseudonocardia kujensis]
MSLPGTVVAGVDGSDHATEAARWAAAEAARNRCVLRLVRAYRLPPSSAPEASSLLWSHAHHQLWKAAHHARAVVPELAVEQTVVEGDPTEVLLREAAGARVLVVGPRGVGGFAGLLVGSVGTALARRAPCPLVVVRGPVLSDDALVRTDRVRPVVVGVDGSPASETALAFAFAEADAWAAPLVALHAWVEYLEDPDALTGLAELEEQEHEVLAERLAGWTGKYPAVRVSRELVHGPPARALVARSADARLVVVGSVGRGRLGSALLGSTGRALLHHAHAPVAVVSPGL